MTMLLTSVTEDVRPPARDERLASARAYIEGNFHRVPLLPEIAAVARLSPFHFQRRFRRTYGQTPKQVMTALQVAEVQRLIAAGAPLDEAARSAGFSHQSHMCFRFKRIVGTTPGQWARRSRKIPV